MHHLSYNAGRGGHVRSLHENLPAEHNVIIKGDVKSRNCGTSRAHLISVGWKVVLEIAQAGRQKIMTKNSFDPVNPV